MSFLTTLKGQYSIEEFGSGVLSSILSRSTMEELEPAQTTPPVETLNPNSIPVDPPNTTQNFSHLPPPDANRKRPVNQNDQIQNSSIFKMRAVLKGLRPHFLEVIRSPDIKNCKAAGEIRQQMKVLMDLYKEIIEETIPVGSEVQNGEKSGEPDQEQGRVKIVDHQTPPATGESDASKESWEDGAVRGTYIVGGSAFGWNFVTYLGTTKSEYYGRTKEMFRSANVVRE